MCEVVLLLGEDTVDFSWKEDLVDLRSNNCEVKDMKDVRRRRAFSRGVFCTIMETGRGRRLVASEVVLGIKEAGWSITSGGR